VADKLRDCLPHANLKHCLAVERDHCLSSQELANIADQYESNFFPDGRYKGLSITAGQSGGKLKPPSNGRYAMADQAQATQNDVTRGSVDTGSLPSSKSPSTKRKLFSTPLSTKKSVRCWKCGEMGHTSKEHYDTSSPHYSDVRPSGKLMAVNACVTQIPDSSREVAQAQDAVQINHCAVLERKTQCVSFGESSPEGPLFNFTSERCGNHDSSECGNTVGVEPGGVSMTCESVTDINSLIPPLDYVSVDREGSEQTYKTPLDSGAMIAVAKSSRIPQELREIMGKTQLQGAFGECVEAELSVLKVRLHRPDAETAHIPIMFALTDALASKEYDMLLPAHAVKELHAYSGICVTQTVFAGSVTVSDSECHAVSTACVNVNNTDNTTSANTQDSSELDDTLILDSASIHSEDDLDQDCEVENVDVPPIEIVDPSNLDLLIKEQHDDKSLAPFWQMAKQNKGRMFIKQGLLYHRDTVGGLPVEQLAVPVNRREEVIRLAHQTLTGGHMRAQKNRERLKLYLFFPGMRKQVFTSLAQCKECQLRARQKVSDNVPISPIVRPTLPFMVAHADLIGPLDPVSSKGHAHALCIVDACTRWPTAYLLKSTNVTVFLTCFSTLACIRP